VGAENPVASCDLQILMQQAFGAGLVVAPGWPLAASGGQMLAITVSLVFATPAESDVAPSTEARSVPSTPGKTLRPPQVEHSTDTARWLGNRGM
jgi:hypothetical protein